MRAAAAFSLARRPRMFAALAMVAAVFIADLALPPPLHRVNAVSALALDRSGAWLHAFATPEGRWRFTAALDEIDPSFVERLIEIEDKRFREHFGVDLFALGRAAATSARAGRIVSGGSTITMQLARLLEPRDRTVLAKGVEIIRALQIERRLSKDEILAAYLTMTPYGGNLEGVRAASLSYFGKEPARLTLAEQALLIALPQAPEGRRPDRKAAAAQSARRIVLQRLVEAGSIDARLAAEAVEAPLPLKRARFPEAAYHAARSLAHVDRRASSDFTTTIDLRKQLAAEHLVAEHAAALDDGATAAAIIIDAKSREVLASVGSSGRNVDGGWIDLTTASRSPGSLIKPFIYALAFDDGVVSERTLILDKARGFGSYRPENFDRVFRGEVRVADALQHSLNIPAVAVLEKVGATRLDASLAAAGARVKTRRRADQAPGLAIALGAGGLSLREVGTLYAALADGGVVKPLVWTRMNTGASVEETEAGYKLMSAESASRINAVLSGSPSLAGRAPASLSGSAPVIAFKTGTSYGYRDAWAAGHAGGLVIAVWVGRADGAPRPGSTGRAVAAPLLFSLFDRLLDAPLPCPAADAAFAEPSAALDRARKISGRTERPTIVFPAPGAELVVDDFADARKAVMLTAAGGSGALQWYVDGAPVPVEAESGRAMWRPAAAGFYDLTVVDAAGASTTAKVRVVSS